MKSIRKKIATTKAISVQSKLMMYSEKMHIKAHLALTELRLRWRSRKINNESLLRKREKALDILNEYWRNGVFPINSYDKTQRNPVFIDEQGTYCAVGYLMKETGDKFLARSIDDSNKFLVIENTNDARIDNWIHNNGLDSHEASLIQPGYGGVTLERVDYSLVDKILAGFTIVLSFILIAIISQLLSIMFTKTLAKIHNSDLKIVDYKSSVKKYAGASLIIIVLLTFILPTPLEALRIYSVEGDSKRVDCSWGVFEPQTDEEERICDSYYENGKKSGWEPIPIK